jgi:hypothetical protein
MADFRAVVSAPGAGRDDAGDLLLDIIIPRRAERAICATIPIFMRDAAPDGTTAYRSATPLNVTPLMVYLLVVTVAQRYRRMPGSVRWLLMPRSPGDRDVDHLVHRLVPAGIPGLNIPGRLKCVPT